VYCDRVGGYKERGIGTILSWVSIMGIVTWLEVINIGALVLLEAGLA
jgi:hypothetical protein